MKRMKVKRIFITALVILVAYVLQCTVFPVLDIAGIKPNLLLIVTASFGFMRGSKSGMLVGFLSGLLIDIQFGKMIGFYALIYLVVGFLNGLFEQMFYDEDIKLPLFLIAVSDFLYGITIYFFTFLLNSDFRFTYYLNRIIVPEMIYTIVITLGVYPLLLFINHKLCERVFVAIGQDIDSKPFEDMGIACKWGCVITDSDGAVPNFDGLFSGGDCQTGPATVIRAINAGRVASANIDRYLGFDHKIKLEVELPTVQFKGKHECGRCELGEREAGERIHDWDLVEQGLTEEEARQEASRCLRCDHFGFGAFRGGRNLEW